MGGEHASHNIEFVCFPEGLGITLFKLLIPVQERLWVGHRHETRASVYTGPPRHSRGSNPATKVANCLISRNTIFKNLASQVDPIISSDVNNFGGDRSCDGAEPAVISEVVNSRVIVVRHRLIEPLQGYHTAIPRALYFGGKLTERFDESKYRVIFILWHAILGSINFDWLLNFNYIIYFLWQSFLGVSQISFLTLSQISLIHRLWLLHNRCFDK